MSAAFQTYDFTLGVGQSQRIPVFGKYVRVQTATGAVNLRGDFGYLKNLLPGQGQSVNTFSYVTIEDASGAANVGSIIVGEEGFVDNRMILGTSSALALDSPTQIALRTPFASTGNYKSNTALVANTPDTVFLPATNINGAIILSASAFDYDGNNTPLVLLAKNAAPTTDIDGEVLASSSITVVPSSNYYQLQLQGQQYIAAGLGLYFIQGTASGTVPRRYCRYKLL